MGTDYRLFATILVGVVMPGCGVVDPRPASQVPDAPILWHHVEGPAAFGPAAFDGARAYFETQDHRVVAVDAQTGTTAWTASTVHADGSAPLDGRNFFGCVTVGETVACGDEDVVGLRRIDGTVMWRYRPAIGGSPAYYEGAVVDSTIIMGSPYGGMSAVDARTGNQRWAVQLFPSSPETLVIDPVADSDIVVAPYKTFTKPPTGGVVALDTRTGTVRWTTGFPPPVRDTLTGGRSVALWQNMVLASSENGRIYAMDRTTGSILWSLPDVGGRFPPSPGNLNGTPYGLSDARQIVASGSTLYVASSSAWFHAYDLEKHTMLWRTTADLGSASGQRIATDGNAVYVLQAAGQLVAFSLSEPKILWESGGGLYEGYFGRVTFGPGRIFLGGKQGFYAIAR